LAVAGRPELSTMFGTKPRLAHLAAAAADDDDDGSSA